MDRAAGNARRHPVPSAGLAQVTEGSRRQAVPVQSGYDSAEVTRDGMSTDVRSSTSMSHIKIPGLPGGRC